LRLQFATIEAIVSLIIAISATSAAAAMINNYQHYYGMARSNASASSAAYDLLSQLSQNSAAAQCIGNASAAVCNFADYYGKIYGIRGIGVISGVMYPHNYTDIYCANESSVNLTCVWVYD
jgi:hypothetical protein